MVCVGQTERKTVGVVLPQSGSRPREEPPSALHRKTLITEELALPVYVSAWDKYRIEEYHI